MNIISGLVFFIAKDKGKGLALGYYFREHDKRKKP